MFYSITPLKASDFFQWSHLFSRYCHREQVGLTQSMLVSSWNQLFCKDDPVEALVVRNKAGVLIGFCHFQKISSPLISQSQGFLVEQYVDNPEPEEILLALHNEVTLRLCGSETTSQVPLSSCIAQG